MKILGWILRLLIVAMGVGLFVLQSFQAKKTILEAILNKPFQDTAWKVDVQDVRGFFPFQFMVTSLNLKEGEKTLASFSDISANWLAPALLSQEIKFNVHKEQELTGHITYAIGSHQVFVHLQSKYPFPMIFPVFGHRSEAVFSSPISPSREPTLGVERGSKIPPHLGPKIPEKSSGMGKVLNFGKKLALKSVDVTISARDLLQGQIKTLFYDGQNLATLTIQMEEIEKGYFRLPSIHLVGQGIEGKGYVNAYVQQGLWEGQAYLSIQDLGVYAPWFEKALAGSATLNCRKTFKSTLSSDLHLERFQYGNFKAKSLNSHATILDKNHFYFEFQGQDTSLNSVLLTKLSAVGTLKKEKGTFGVKGVGTQNTSLQMEGTFERPTAENSETRIRVTHAQLSHPFHQFALKEPVQFTSTDKGLYTPKMWLAVGEGNIILHDMSIGDQLTGTVVVERLPLTLLRIIYPGLIASGHMSGKGKIRGTKEKPEAELLLEGQSLQWGVPHKAPKGMPHHFSGIDLSSTVKLNSDSLDWHLKISTNRLASLISHGKLALAFSPLKIGPLEATLKGQAELGIISLVLPITDLVQGQANLDLTMRGTMDAPLVNGRLFVTKGVYENAIFGTLIKNIKIEGKATNNKIILSHISGQDNAKGRVQGHGSIKFLSPFNPDLDLQLNLAQLIVVQNDEISGKASGMLRLHGALSGGSQVKITGDVVLQPLEIRLDEHETKIAAIKLQETKGAPHQLIDEQEHSQPIHSSTALPLDIYLRSPGQVYLTGQGFDAQWKGEMKAIGPIMDPQLVGEMTLVRGKFDLLGKSLKLTEGRILYASQSKNDPLLNIVGTRDIGEITAIMRIDGYASNPKVTFSSIPALSQEQVLAHLLFGKSLENVSATQSLLLANSLSALKGKNKLNFTDKLRSAFGLDVLELKEKKLHEGDEFQSASQFVSVGKQISDKVYLSLDQSVNGQGGTSATIQLDVTPRFKVEADVGGNTNAGVGFAWVKKY